MYSLEDAENSQVRAALSGAKTQFRKVLKEQPTDLTPMKDPDFHLWDVWVWVGAGGDKKPIKGLAAKDDVIFVREYFRIEPGDKPSVVYRSDSDSDPDERWEPPENMPKWAVRLKLTVTDVRLQRLQDISEEDAKAEGVRPDRGGGGYAGAYAKIGADPYAYMRGFKDLWDSINAKRGYGWDENPWVAAYTFTVDRRNIDG